MYNPWLRSNLAIAARIIVALVLIAAVVWERPLWERLPAATRVGAASVGAASVGAASAATSLAIKTATQTARPGQRIAVVVDVDSSTRNGAEVVLLVDGQPVARRAASPSVIFELAVPESGPLVLGAELRDPASQLVLEEAPGAAVVNVATTPSVTVVSNTPSTFGASLREGGWPVMEMMPDALASELGILATTSTLVLDNIAADDLQTVAIDAIEHKVAREAMGLLVLGGPDSFALGGYRDSQLETMLPVVSEPPDSEPPANVMFLIDVSGSMDKAAGATNRLQIAKQAVTETSRALRAIDRVGLMTFDVEAEQRLPLATRSNHAQVIEQSWPDAASGGTRLVPALLTAIDDLEQGDNAQDLLVILTDGNVSEEDLGRMELVLQSTDVEIIALVVAAGSRSHRSRDALINLLEATGHRATSISDLLHLPSLMRNEVEENRPAVISGPAELSVNTPTSWLPEADWPSIDQYLLTRARQDATVHIVGAASVGAASSRDDVILASRPYGAGNVIAVTSGFSSWTTDWLQSEQWPEFAAAILGQLGTRDSSGISVSFDERSSLLVVDTGGHHSTSPPAATLVDPSGETAEVTLEPDGPGRFVAGLQPGAPGLYLAVINGEFGEVHHHFLNHPTEDMPEATAEPMAEPGLDRQGWLAILALLGFLFVLWWERQ